jgi:hypothetical protein
MANGVYHGIPRWARAGYQIKNHCEKCGFKSIGVRKNWLRFKGVFYDEKLFQKCLKEV